MPCYKNQRCCDHSLDSNGMMLIMVVNKDAVMMANADGEEDASSVTSTVAATKEGSCCAAMEVVDDITVSSSSSCESSSSSNNQTPTTTRRKTVHFDESQNQIYVDTRRQQQPGLLYDFDFWAYKNDVWYNALDYQHFKMTTSHIASRIAHATDSSNTNSNMNDDAFARTYYKVLLRTYQACCQASSVAAVNNSSSDDHDVMMMDDSTNDEDNDNIKCHSKNSNFVLFDNATEQAQALQWIHAACANGALLGVAEKHAIYEIVLDRLHRRMELVSAILEIQEAFYSSVAENADNHGQCQAAAVAELMRVASCEKSRPSRLFAQVLAQAVL